MYFKKLLAIICTIFFTGLLVIYPQIAVSSAYRGLRLWSDVVFPSLMPFFVCSEILNKLNFPKKISIYFEPVMKPLFNVPGSGAYPFVMGITSGYPVGAKIIADMRQNNLLTREQGERLLAFCNNSGPLFIIGAVSTGMLNRPDLGIILVLLNIASALTVGIILGFLSKRNNKAQKSCYSFNKANPTMSGIKNKQTNVLSFSSIFGQAISESAELQLKICGFIVVFSVIINLLLKTGILLFLLKPVIFFGGYFTGNIPLIQSLAVSICCGMLEITIGISLISSLDIISLNYKICIIVLLIGWAGVSVHSQVASIVKKTDMSLKVYCIGKSLQGIICSLYAFLVFKFLEHKSITMIQQTSAHLFNSLIRSRAGFEDSIKYFTVSGFLLLLSLFIILSAIMLIAIIKYFSNSKHKYLYKN
ncbi:MAG: nucleoside recognition domain-containing protein [Bacteroidales bacterium]